MKNRIMYMLTGGGGSKLSRATRIAPRVTLELRSYARVERATGETALSTASASVGVLREAQSRLSGFTMAEILLSLTIIGVVAAITLPSLTGNINERTWNTQRKALYARFSQAISLMPSLNGYGTLDASDTNNVAETFVTSGLAKVLKINNICDSEHLADCGIPAKINPLGSGSPIVTPTTLVGLNKYFNTSQSYSNGVTMSYSQYDTKAAAFETANGESILVYYSPTCIPKINTGSRYYLQKTVCANFIYDLNGSKGPNTVGKDIGFITAIYPSDPVVVAPMPLVNNNSTQKKQNLIGEICKTLDENSRAVNIEEASAIFVNRYLLNIVGDDYWSTTLDYNSNGLNAYMMSMYSGNIHAYSRETEKRTICIQR